MSALIEELKDLRAKCAALIVRLDAVLPECEDRSCGQQRRELVVPGRCETITQHALDRYRERTGSTKGDGAICNKIACRIASGVELELKAKYRVLELIDHGDGARYFRNADLIFVINDGCVVTCHTGTADRWIPKTTETHA